MLISEYQLKHSFLPLNILKTGRTVIPDVPFPNDALSLWDIVASYLSYGTTLPSSTNLSYVSSAASGQVMSDTGTDATLPAATTSLAGLFLPAEKIKLSGITNVVSSVGTLSLLSNILTLPVTTDGITTNRTLDLSNLDVKATALSASSSTYVLTLTNSDSSTATVNLLPLITAGENQRLSLSGNNLSITKGDGVTVLNTIAIPSQYTDENAQDAVGNILTDSTSIDFTYNDSANTITAVSKVSATALNNLTIDATGLYVQKGAGSTATNGLNLASPGVHALGGPLTSATTITTTVSNTLSISGLSSDNAEDTLLAIDNTTGLLSKRSVSSIAGALAGSGVDGRLTLWNGASSVTSNSMLTYDLTTGAGLLQLMDSSTTSGRAGLYVSSSGASAGTNYGINVSKTGASVGNVAVYATASGASILNYAGQFVGNVNIGTGAQYGYLTSTYAGGTGNTYTVGAIPLSLGNTAGGSTTLAFTSNNVWIGGAQFTRISDGSNGIGVGRWKMFSTNDATEPFYLQGSASGILIGGPDDGTLASRSLHVVGNARITGLTPAGYVANDVSGNLSTVTATSIVSSGGGYINGGNSFGANATIGLNDAFSLGIYTAGTQRIVIDSTGRMGFGSNVSTTTKAKFSTSTEDVAMAVVNTKAATLCYGILSNPSGAATQGVGIGINVQAATNKTHLYIGSGSTYGAGS